MCNLTCNYMASGSTSIDDLPTGDNPNVTLETNDKPVQNVPTVTQPQMAQLSPDDINKIVSGLQSASQQNLTTLPSRDIPMNTMNVATDKQIQPNFVPDSKHQDYIQQHDTAQTIYEKQLAKERTRVKQDELYDQLQTPIMVMVLFFLFHLPIINKVLYRYLPALFIKDGNMSFGGYLFKSVTFGASYFVIMKLIDYMSQV